jgi:hypothetical protein
MKSKYEHSRQLPLQDRKCDMIREDTSVTPGLQGADPRRQNR